MVEKYCLYYQHWRNFFVDYLNITHAESKQYLINIFFGFQPIHDIPFLRKLSDEIKAGVNQILEFKKLEELEVFIFRPIFK